ncbi:MAG: hypothetical protein RIM23_03330 [Coleofasciculus sp. G3-WIS-01]|uniref:hypothetical protein n=1 Tax=Coleofasciculus sp. G3-WIS-01 TaxID=3069528 RepID=UPI0032F1B2ED
MTFMPVLNDDPFERYFYRRAELANKMADQGFEVDAYTLATASLDALAEIWLHDFPDVKQDLQRELGGGIPSSIRLARLLKKFVPNDSDVKKVAVVCFAEDWKRYRPQDTHMADQLLSKRLSNDPDPFLRAYESPKSYLDISRDKLAQECPELTTRPELLALAEEYEYGALLYSFYRCPLVHLATGSRRTHGFAREEEIMYYHGKERIAIGFGLNLVTRWLRNVVSGYVQFCQQSGIVPAKNIDAGTNQEERLAKRWNKLT